MQMSGACRKRVKRMAAALFGLPDFSLGGKFGAHIRPGVSPPNEPPSGRLLGMPPVGPRRTKREAAVRFVPSTVVFSARSTGKKRIAVRPLTLLLGGAQHALVDLGTNEAGIRVLAH